LYSRLRVLDSVHGGFDDVRLDGNGDGADLCHALFGRVLGVFIGDAFALVRLGPVLLEQPLLHPFLTRPRE
jgi:hypothetical protein